MDHPLPPLGGDAVMLLFLQLAALLVVARFGAEVVRRVGLPTVVGELAAGILLGPTMLGHFAPGAFLFLFPPRAEAMHLLEALSWLGMVLLLLLTGIETDVRLLRNLGKAAAAASVFGMIVPFIFGLSLGFFLPERYVAMPEHRTLFSLFLATGLSISAMPVIAKILMDLDLTRRNIGVVILSAGVVDDTTGWILLSLIASAAQGNPSPRHLALAIGGTALFALAMAFIAFPVLKWAFRVATDRFQSKETDLVLMVAVTLVCAAVTDALGVHAVFGAFVAGCTIRQVPRVRPQTRHLVESFTFSIFAPIFFGLVGLKVDLWKLSGANIFLVVLGVATAGKLLGCTLGSLLGGLRFWESVSIAIAMNARGAMELVVATIGLSLGILNQEMFSVVVMVAVATTFAAPLLLRLTMPLVRMTEEEARRIAAESAKGLFDPSTIRILVPTAGGPNALAAADLGLRIARRSSTPVTLLYVERTKNLWERLLRNFRPSLEGRDLSLQVEQVRRAAAQSHLPAPEMRRLRSRDVAGAIHQEAAKGYNLVLVGGTDSRTGLRGDKLEALVAGASCHIAIVRSAPSASAPFRRVLVPVDGTFDSRVALEFAVRYAEGVGEEAEVALAIVTGRDPEPAVAPFAAATISRRGAHSVGQDESRATSIIQMADSLSKEGGLEKLSPIFKATQVRTKILMRNSAEGHHSLLEEISSGRYDLVVVGAEHRAIHYRLFFGYETERILEQSPVSTAIVVPRLEM